ncbi:DNA ligase D [Alteribacillus sp. JSM 102045]|uniref:DNA ligase D n=1 Tax=Alteribacillus sp. JSM 102045 TaxID=1562101 RepID=UPI0035C1F0BC
MAWMKPSRTNKIPIGKNWHYEIKYDGYRARLSWNGKELSLISKNGHSLEHRFPEVVDTAKHFFPTDITIELDGELTVLENPGRADFYSLQSRHRMRAEYAIQKEAERRPVCFLAFDCLSINGEKLLEREWIERKNKLKEWMGTVELPLTPDPHNIRRVQLIPSFQEFSMIEEEVQTCLSEGVVAKNITSVYEKGRTNQWLKFKTPFIVTCFITAYDPANDYFQLSVYNEEEILPIGKCAHGFSRDEKEAVIATIKQNGEWDAGNKKYHIDPSIVVETTYTTRKDKELREPRFSQLLLQTPVSKCTKNRLYLSDLRFPQTVNITHPDKPLWPEKGVKKKHFLHYVRYAAPYILPFLKDRPLTVIRYPHGMLEEGFFQKDCPDYAPEFVETTDLDDNHFILCNKVETLLWLANQLALEWHVPFQRYHTTYVDEIVFDLDPPDPNYFHLAIEGALLLKELCDKFQLFSFVKFSGNKGLQVYIPLPENAYTWSDTNQITTAFGAFLTKKHPKLFTQERLKKKRGRKLYIDVPQHREGKTIIAPYSLRGKADPLIACPLYWEEVSSSLDRKRFTMDYVLERLIINGCPFKKMEEVKRDQPLDYLLSILEDKN